MTRFSESAGGSDEIEAKKNQAAHDAEPEPEPEPETEEGVPPSAALVPTSTLPARSYSGEEVDVMYHGTDSRAAQLIASSQRFHQFHGNGTPQRRSVARLPVP